MHNLFSCIRPAFKFTDSANNQNLKWNDDNYKREEYHKLRYYYKNIIIDHIIKDYSFKDHISGEIFSTTFNNDNINTKYQVNNIVNNNNSNLDQLIDLYFNHLKDLKTPQGIFNLSKHYSDILDKRYFKIKQLLYYYKYEYIQSKLHSPLYKESKKLINDKETTVFFLKSFLAPKVIEYLPEDIILNVINELKTISLPVLPKQEIWENFPIMETDQKKLESEVIAHINEFTKQSIQWLVLVMKYFSKSSIINKESLLALNHMCYQSNDSFGYYLIIKQLLNNKYKTINNYHISIKLQLEEISRSYQGPRDCFPYGLLISDYCSIHSDIISNINNNTDILYCNCSQIYHLQIQDKYNIDHLIFQNNNNFLLFTISQSCESPKELKGTFTKLLLNCPEGDTQFINTIQNKIIICYNNSNILNIYTREYPFTDKISWNSIKVDKKLFYSTNVLKTITTYNNYIYFIYYINDNNNNIMSDNDNPQKYKYICKIGKLIDNNITFENIFEFTLSDTIISCITDGRFFICKQNNNKSILIENINIIDPIINDLPISQDLVYCLNISKEYIWILNSDIIKRVKIPLYKYENNSITSAEILWNNILTNNNNNNNNNNSYYELGLYMLCLLDKIAEFSSWDYYLTIHNTSFIDIYYDILSCIIKPLSSNPSDYQINILLSCIRLLYNNLLHYLQILEDNNIYIKTKYIKLLNIIINYCEKNYDINTDIIIEILSYVYNISLFPFWYKSDKYIKSCINIFNKITKINNNNLWDNIFSNIYKQILTYPSNIIHTHTYIINYKIIINNWKKYKKTRLFYTKLLNILFTCFYLIDSYKPIISDFITYFIESYIDLLFNSYIKKQNNIINIIFPSIITLIWKYKNECTNMLELLLTLLNNIYISPKLISNINSSAFYIKQQLIETPHPYITKVSDDYEQFFNISFPGADFITITFSRESNISPNCEVNIYDSEKNRRDINFYVDNKEHDYFDINTCKFITIKQDSFSIYINGIEADYYGLYGNINAYFSISKINDNFSYNTDIAKSLGIICGTLISNNIEKITNIQSSNSLISNNWVNEKSILFKSGLQQENNIIYNKYIPFLFEIVNQSTKQVKNLIKILQSLNTCIVIGSTDTHSELFKMELYVFITIIQHCGLGNITKSCTKKLYNQQIDIDDSELASIVFIWNQSRYIREWAFKQYNDYSISYSILLEQVKNKCNFLISNIIPVIIPSSSQLDKNTTNNKNKRKSSLRRSATIILPDLEQSSQEINNNRSKSSINLSSSSIIDKVHQNYIDKLCLIQSRSSVASSPASRYINICLSILKYIQSTNPSIDSITKYLQNKTELCYNSIKGYKQLLFLLKTSSFKYIAPYCTSKLHISHDPLRNLQGSNYIIKEQLIQQYYELIDYLLPSKLQNINELNIETLYLCQLNIASFSAIRLIKDKKILYKISDIICFIWDDSNNIFKYLVYLLSYTIVQSIQYINNNISQLDYNSLVIRDELFIDIINILSNIIQKQLFLSSNNLSQSWIIKEVISLLYGIREEIEYFPNNKLHYQDTFINILLELLPNCDTNEQIKLINIFYNQLQGISPSRFNNILLKSKSFISITSYEWIYNILQVLGNYTTQYHFSNINDINIIYNIDSNNIGLKRKYNGKQPKTKKQKISQYCDISFKDSKEHKFAKQLSSVICNNLSNYKNRSIIREFIWMFQKLLQIPIWNNYILQSINYSNLSQDILLGIFSIFGGIPSEIYLSDKVRGLSNKDNISFNGIIGSIIKDYYFVYDNTSKILSPLLLSSNNISLQDIPNINTLIPKSIIPILYSILQNQHSFANIININFILRILIQYNEIDNNKIVEYIISHLNNFSTLTNKTIKQINFELSYLREEYSFIKHSNNDHIIKKPQDIIQYLSKVLPHAILPKITKENEKNIKNIFSLMLPCYILCNNNKLYEPIRYVRNIPESILIGNYNIPSCLWLDSYYYEITIDNKHDYKPASFGFTIKYKTELHNKNITINTSGFCLYSSYSYDIHINKNDTIGCGFYYKNNNIYFCFITKSSNLTYFYSNPLLISNSTNITAITTMLISNTGYEFSINFGQNKYNFKSKFLQWLESDELNNIIQFNTKKHSNELTCTNDKNNKLNINDTNSSDDNLTELDITSSDDISFSLSENNNDKQDKNDNKKINVNTNNPNDDFDMELLASSSENDNNDIINNNEKQENISYQDNVNEDSHSDIEISVSSDDSLSNMELLHSNNVDDTISSSEDEIEFTEDSSNSLGIPEEFLNEFRDQFVNSFLSNLQDEFSNSESDSDDFDENSEEDMLYFSEIDTNIKSIPKIDSIDSDQLSYWTKNSVPESKDIYPYWISKKVLLPQNINEITIGCTIVVLNDKKNIKIGIVKEISWCLNSVYVNFINSMEWIAIQNISYICKHLSLSYDEFRKRIIDFENKLSSKLCLQTLLLSTSYSLKDIIGNGTCKQSKIFIFLCQENIKIPLNNKYDITNIPKDGIITPIISPKFSNMLESISNMFLKGIESYNMITLKILDNFIDSCKTEVLNNKYSSSIICTNNIIKSFTSTELLIYGEQNKQGTNVYYDKNKTNIIGKYYGGIHCSTNKVYIDSMIKDIKIFSRGYLIQPESKDYIESNFFYLYGCFIIIFSLLRRTNKSYKYLDKFINNDDIIKSLINHICKDKKELLGLDPHFLFIINQILQLRSKSLSNELCKYIKTKLVPYIVYGSLMSVYNSLDNMDILNAWNNACFEFFILHPLFFPQNITKKHRFDLFIQGCRSSINTLNILNNPKDSKSDYVLKYIVTKLFTPSIIKESNHPYTKSYKEEISFPGAYCIVIAFDQKSHVSKLEIFKHIDDKKPVEIYGKYSTRPYDYYYILKSSFAYSVSPPKQGKQLWGFKFTAIPIYIDNNIRNTIFNNNKKEAEKILKRYKKYHKKAKNIWTKERECQLVSLIDYFIENDDRGGYYIEVYELNKLINNLSDNKLQKYPLLYELSREELIYRGSLLLEINDPAEYITRYTSFINYKIPGTLSNLLVENKYRFFYYEKREYLKSYSERNELEDDTMPSISINRLESDGISLFKHIFSQLKLTHFSCSREQMFKVNFIGEDGIDEGGLFRDAINIITKNIQNTFFILTPNCKNQLEYGEYYIPNPCLYSSEYIQYYEFIGRLLGGALLSCSILSGLSFPLLIYKVILGLELNDNDYKEIDSLFYESIESLNNISENDIESKYFTDVISLVFTIRTLNGKEVELIPNGNNISVNLDNRLEYINLSLQYKRNEIQLQLKALQRGFIQETKDQRFYFNWFLPNELKRLIEGEKKINLNNLRKITHYSNCNEDSIIIKYFWNILESFDEDQRREFLQFTSGSPVLPIGNNRTFTIYLNTATSIEYLPSAHTCSWRMDIPNYPSEKLFKEKLLLSLASGSGFTFA